MARVNAYVPDELEAMVKRLLPDVNHSKILQEGLRALLACQHGDLACESCGHHESRADIEDQALGRFYGDLQWELGQLAQRGGTAEGAARVAKSLAERYRIKLASKLPLPRPSRAERQAAKVRDLPNALTREFTGESKRSTG